MSWERGRYYTRSRRVNGRIRREYVGHGPLAEAVAESDRIERLQRTEQRRAHQSQVAEIMALNNRLDQLERALKEILEEQLEAHGYRLHKRGEWRRRRNGH
jgi:hypothetical protein